MTVDEMANRLIELTETMAYFNHSFPYKHTYDGAGVPTLQAREWLAPAGYLTYDWEATGDVYTITRAGYELIRDKLPAELKKRGDAYYKVEME